MDERTRQVIRSAERWFFIVLGGGAALIVAFILVVVAVSSIGGDGDGDGGPTFNIDAQTTTPKPRTDMRQVRRATSSASAAGNTWLAAQERCVQRDSTYDAQAQCLRAAYGAYERRWGSVETALRSAAGTSRGTCLRKLRTEARAIALLRTIIRKAAVVAVGGSADMALTTLLVVSDAGEQAVAAIRGSVVPACSS